MLISATAALAADKNAPILYRGPFEETFPEIAGAGFGGVELHLEDSSALDRESVWRLLRDNGLRLTSIGTGSAYGRRGLNLVDQDAQLRRRTIDHLEAHMRLLEEDHGVVIVGLIAGRARDSRAPLDEQKRRLAESLRELDERAQRHGVRVGLEIMNRYECDFLHTVEEGMAFLDGIPGLLQTCLHVDSVSMNIQERDIGAAIRAGKGRIGHVHLADNDRWYPGHGHYDFRQTLQALRDIGYDGALALEEKALPSTREAAARSLGYLNTMLSVLY